MKISGATNAGYAGGRMFMMSWKMQARDGILEARASLKLALVAVEALESETVPKVTLPDLIAEAASKHGLPPNLVQAMVSVESGGNPWAVRFEPGFLKRYVDTTPQRFGPVTIETERQGRATSWGLMQVMGETARGLGFKGVFFSELCDPATGLEFGCMYLANQVKRYHGDIPSAVAAYNAGTAVRVGGGPFRNQKYVDKVMTADRPSARVDGPLAY